MIVTSRIWHCTYLCCWWLMASSSLSNLWHVEYLAQSFRQLFEHLYDSNEQYMVYNKQNADLTFWVTLYMCSIFIFIHHRLNDSNQKVRNNKTIITAEITETRKHTQPSHTQSKKPNWVQISNTVWSRWHVALAANNEHKVFSDARNFCRNPAVRTTNINLWLN